MTRKKELISHILTIIISLIIVSVMIFLGCITPKTFSAKLGEEHTVTVESIERSNLQADIIIIHSREYTTDLYVVSNLAAAEKVWALKSGDKIVFSIPANEEFTLKTESKEESFAILRSLKINGEEVIDRKAWNRAENGATAGLVATSFGIAALFFGFLIYGVVKLIKMKKNVKSE